MQLDNGDCAILLATAMGCFVIDAFLHHSKRPFIKFLPASGLFILCGCALAGVLLIFVPTRHEIAQRFGFSTPIFNLFLLPPLIFDGGYTLKQLMFWRNFTRIVTMAVLGTLISTIVVGCLTYIMGREGLYADLGWAESLAFGALISATDPVASLVTFGQMDINLRLYAIVFGESILNDAVAVVLFSTTSALIGSGVSESTYVDAVTTFLRSSLASVGFGVAVGVLSAMVFKYLRFLPKDTTLSVVLFYSFGYISFLGAQALGCSGIVSTLFCALVMRHYTYYNVHLETARLTLRFSAVVARMAEVIIYIQVGITLVTTPGWSLLVPSSLAWINIGRFLAVFSLSLGLNLASATFRSSNPRISLREQLAIWHTGLRGSIALSLALTLPDQHRDMITAATCALVLWTVFFNGGTTGVVLRLLCIKSRKETDTEEEGAREPRVDGEDAVPRPAAAPLRSQRERHKLTVGEIRMVAIDDRFVRPLLTNYEHGKERHSSTRLGQQSRQQEMRNEKREAEQARELVILYKHREDDEEDSDNEEEEKVQEEGGAEELEGREREAPESEAEEKATSSDDVESTGVDASA